MNVKNLENQYLLAKQKYYEGNPIMSDYEFDLLEENLNNHGSHVTKIVGSQNLKDAKFNHISPMLSLSKIQVHHNILFPTDTFLKWYNSYMVKGFNFFLEATPKFDGSSCNLIYDENGILEWALTRGDKVKGQNIIDKMKLIVPNSINNIKCKVEVRGEVVIPIDVFNAKYSKIYKNPRNFVAGILGRDDIDESIIKDFHFVAFEAKEFIDGKSEHINDVFEYLKKNLFTISPKIELFNSIDFESIYNQFLEFRKTAPYQLDGIVIKFNEGLRAYIGETSHHPNWAIAIKFPPMESITTINNIIWNVGISGEYTPVGELEPIDLDGTTVSNVNLHNYGNVIKQGLLPGAKVIIVKSGDIIPIVQKVIKPSNEKIENHLPEPCSPECKTEVQGNIHLVCTNPNCPNKSVLELMRGISVFGFRNIAGSTIKKIHRAGITTINDVFDNSKFNEANLIASGEFKKGRQLEILMEARNNPNNKITLPLVIVSLAFSNVGYSIANQIAKLFDNETPDWTSLSSACYLPFLNNDGSLNTNSESYKKVINFIKVLEDNGFPLQKDKKQVISQDTIKYEMTGSPKDYGFAKKDEFVKLLKEHNYAHTKLDSNTNILITDDINSSSSKMAKAKKLGIQILTYDQVLESINK
jgi:DNA ligase (NAD+)